MAKGDHVYVCYPGFEHHGIDCGDGWIIHLDKKYEGKIAEIPKEKFTDGRQIHIKKYGKCDDANDVIARAKEKLGKNGYCLFTNNCEHFAYYCKTGISRSEQVKRATSSAAGTVANTAAGTGVFKATNVAHAVAQAASVAEAQAASIAAKKALNPIAKTLVNLGLKQAPVVAPAAAKVATTTALSIAGIGGLVTGVVTDLAVGKVLEDDEHLPQNERDARGAGRMVSKIGSTVGGIGGVVAVTMIGGGAAIAGAVAAPVVLGVAGAVVAYNLSKKEEDSNTSNQSQESVILKQPDTNTLNPSEEYTVLKCSNCLSKNRFLKNTTKTPVCGKCKQSLS